MTRTHETTTATAHNRSGAWFIPARPWWRSWAGGEAEPVAAAGGELAVRRAAGGAVRERPGSPASGPGHPQSGEYNALLIALHPMAAISLPIPRAGSPLVAV